MISPTQKIGLAGERWAIETLEKLGYFVHYPPNFFTRNRDLYVNGIPCEVKLARTTYRRIKRKTLPDRYGSRWQWIIHDTANHMNEDWIAILIAQDSDGEHWPFVLPGQLVESRQHIQITSHPTIYSGWLAPFLLAWRWIDYLERKIYQRDVLSLEQWEAVYEPV